MTIEWNTVTWYSKLLALIVFGVVMIGGFFVGIRLGYLLGYNDAFTASTGLIKNIEADQNSGAAQDYYTNPGAWAIDQRTDGGFSIQYPIDFQIDDDYSLTPSMDWRLDGNGTPGITYLTITVPSAFEPQTNFADAKLTVGSSRDQGAIKDCFLPDPGDQKNEATSTILLGDSAFTVFHTSGAGAGNYYETTSYRALHAGQCFAVEYTIHSSQIANYPASYGLKPFNEEKITATLEAMAKTFNLQ